MFRYDAFIMLDFQIVLPACRHGFHQWYISIQVRNLGMIYWVLGRHPDSSLARKSRLGEIVFDLVPLCWRGNKHVRGLNRGLNRGPSEIEWGRDLGRGFDEPLPRN